MQPSPIAETSRLFPSLRFCIVSTSEPFCYSGLRITLPRTRGDQHWRQRLLRGPRELALNILEVHAIPAFGHLAINKSAAGMDVEANRPSRRGYTHKLSA